MNSTQLELPFGEWLREPWDGRSPRVLTRGYKALFLRRKPQKDERFFVDPRQLELFDEPVEKAPWKYQGAPLLVDTQ